MSAWESFWRSVRRNGRVIEMSPSDPVPPVPPADTKLSAELAETRWKLFDARARISELETERDAAVRDRQYALEDRDKAIRQRDAFAVEVAKLRRDRNFARSLVDASPEEARRTCLDLSDRNAELRAANERLELEVARLQGRSTEQDWTGGFQPVTTS